MNNRNIINSNLQVSQEKLIELMNKNIFHKLLESGEITLDEVERKIRKFKASYAHIEEKFSHRTRDNGEDSFEHQKEVVFLMLTLSENPTYNKVMILLDHDTIEDTNITISGMRENHNDELVFPIALMSKNPFCEYIDNMKHLSSFQKIRVSGILNSKGTLNDEFYYKGLYKNHQLTHKEKRAYQIYEGLRIRYKNKRNEAYCSQMKSFDIFLEHALKLNEKETFNFSNEKIEELVIDTIECKLWDRLHGIMTLKNCKIEKIKRKIIETENDFKSIALDFFPYIWDLIEKKLNEIKGYIIELEQSKIQNKTRDVLITYGKQECFNFNI